MRIELLAPINSLGYGIASLNILKSLVNLGHEVCLYPIGPIDVSQENFDLVTKAFDNRLKYKKAVNAPSLKIFHQWDLLGQIGKGLHIGFPFFELTRLNETEIMNFQNLDLVFVASQWAKDVLIQNGITTRIEVIPLAVDTTIFPAYSQKTENLDKTVFFTAGKFEYRKGHDAILNCFNKAFSPEDDVLLNVHCWNPCLPPEKSEEWAKFYKGSKLGDKISINVGRFRTQQELANWMAQGDVFLGLSRAEAWNFELSEALCMGKQAIATNYSGHTEYVNSSNCNLVDIDMLEEACDGLFFPQPFGEWAHIGDRQEKSIIGKMQELHSKRKNGVLDVNRGGIHTFQEKFSWEKTAKLIVSHLE